MKCDKKIYLVLLLALPINFMSCLLTYGFFHAEIDCPWNRYIDTKFSDKLNPDNIELVDKINIGMLKDEIIDILGEPLYIEQSYNKDKEWYKYTSDGAAPFDWDFSWFEVLIIFEKNIVVGKRIGWVHD
jgi:outer membrane protein assembly factor BamE (lipoprotein component of BamABCDE complex)